MSPRARTAFVTIILLVGCIVLVPNLRHPTKKSQFDADISSPELNDSQLKLTVGNDEQQEQPKVLQEEPTDASLEQHSILVKHPDVDADSLVAQSEEEAKPKSWGNLFGGAANGSFPAANAPPEARSPPSAAFQAGLADDRASARPNGFGGDRFSSSNVAPNRLTNDTPEDAKFPPLANGRPAQNLPGQDFSAQDSPARKLQPKRFNDDWSGFDQRAQLSDQASNRLSEQRRFQNRQALQPLPGAGERRTNSRSDSLQPAQASRWADWGNGPTGRTEFASTRGTLEGQLKSSRSVHGRRGHELTPQPLARQLAQGGQPAQGSRAVSVSSAAARYEVRKTTDQPGQDEPTLHRIVNGDTLEKLARQYYGDAGKAIFIFEANRRALYNPAILPLGLEVRIPNKR